MRPQFDLSWLFKPEPTRYRRLSWWHRRRIDLRIQCRVIFSRSGLRIFLLAIVIELFALILVFEYDLGGWQRDLLRIVAVVFVWLWLARSRHRHLQELSLTKRWRLN